MGKFDTIDIVFMSLISFYLLIFSIILILLIRKHRGIRGLFRYLLDKNSITITNSGEVIENIEVDESKDNKKEKTLSTKNKVTIKQFFEKRLKSLKKDIAEEVKEQVKEEIKEADKKPAPVKKITNSNKPKTTTTKKNTSASNKKKTSTTKKKPSSSSKKTVSSKKKPAVSKTNSTTKKATTTKKSTNTTKKTTSSKNKTSKK